MIVKEFHPKKSPWGFKITFEKGTRFDKGYCRIVETIGHQTDHAGNMRWYLIQDMGDHFRLSASEENQKKGEGYRGGWRKGRLYVFDDAAAIYMKLLCS